MSGGACERCLARTWLLERLSGHLDVVRARIGELLALTDERLIAAVAGEAAAEVAERWAGWGVPQAAAARRRAAQAGLALVCVCDDAYPDSLRELPAPPAVLHIAGGVDRLTRFCAPDPVAVVGARRAGEYGRSVAWSLARGIAAAGLTVVSGMAEGIDTAAHWGALDVGGATIAVLPGPAQLPRPAANARLHRQLLGAGVVISEVGPDVLTRSWMFAARNRIIAGLSTMTVVVQAGAGSGSLLTSLAGQALGRPVGAVPGQVTSPLAEGPNQLLADGARLIRGAQDVLDALYGVAAPRANIDRRPPPTPDQAALLVAVAEGLSTPEALVRAGIAGQHCLAELTRLELAGRIRRGAGGLLTVLP